ncbi:hypothetical protein K435DRAFT_854055 [Dendrothele bispora CBS 962.96]|uniref:Uncharacterized protein n=1 Tax=Dendrothele bispora (strain CBS 962.96) TaxID=1314807 RepID=A0A4V6T5K3_DENBC|nr:hypothetical protein K435DRAFT_854055 [Dendrothele bispora CBS 962.96]
MDKYGNILLVQRAFGGTTVKYSSVLLIRTQTQPFTNLYYAAISTSHNPNSPGITPVHEDLDEIGPINEAFHDTEWIGCGHIYKDVPSVVAAECAKLLQNPDEYTSLLPNPTDSVDKLLSFALPPAVTNTSVPTFSTEVPSDTKPTISFTSF